jgi:ankyrin repeat protein
VDSQSGKEEAAGGIREIGEREAAAFVSKKLEEAQLRKATGRFRMNLAGCSEPYLATFSGFQIRNLGRLMTAAQVWDLSSIKNLLQELDVNAREGTGRTALIWAAADPRRAGKLPAEFSHQPDDGTVEFLLDQGADANARDNDGITALMRANGSTVGLLLSAGADVNAKDRKGRTALVHAVAWMQDAETVRALLVAGADANAKDEDGKTVLQYARGRERDDIVVPLRRAGAKE